MSKTSDEEPVAAAAADDDDELEKDDDEDDVDSPTEQRLMRQLLRRYERAVRPVHNASDTVMVRMGLTLTQIFNMVSAQFSTCICYLCVFKGLFITIISSSTIIIITHGVLRRLCLSVYRTFESVCLFVLSITQKRKISKCSNLV